MKDKNIFETNQNYFGPICRRKRHLSSKSTSSKSCVFYNKFFRIKHIQVWFVFKKNVFISTAKFQYLVSTFYIFLEFDNFRDEFVWYKMYICCILLTANPLPYFCYICMYSITKSFFFLKIFLELHNSWDEFVDECLVVRFESFHIRCHRTLCVQIVFAERVKEKTGHMNKIF